VVLRTGYKAASELGEKEIMNFFNEETCEKIIGAKEEDLEALHRVLFGRIGAAIHRKRNLVHFEGFDFFQESDDFAAVEKKINEVGPANLVYLCWLFGLEKDGSTEALGRKICIFLCKQVKDTTSASLINRRVAEEIGKQEKNRSSASIRKLASSSTAGRTSVCTRLSQKDEIINLELQLEKEKQLALIDEERREERERLIKLEFQLREKKAASLRSSDKVSSWLSYTENEFRAKEKTTRGGAEHQNRDFESKHCAPLENWVSPPTSGMELMAAVLRTRLLTAVKKELMLPINNEILEATDVNSRKWVPTKLNPADDGTRENVKYFKSDSHWFQGPKFLKLEIDDEPKENKTNETLKDETLANQIGSDGPVSPFCCRWMNKISKKYESSRKVKLEVAGISTESKWHVVNGARTIPNLALPCQKIDVKFLMNRYPYLSKDALETIVDAKPKILIGQDNQSLTVAQEVIQPNCDGPMMTKTEFEWIVHGMINSCQEGVDSVAIVNTCCEDDEDLHEIVKKFMSMENFGVLYSSVDRRKSEEERLSIAKMEESIQKDEQHYVVGLPYICGDVEFPDNWTTAMNKQRCTERKLVKFGLYQQYDEKIAEYVQNGYADAVYAVENLLGRSNLWYLPLLWYKEVRRGVRPIGRIVEVYSGADRVVRVLKVRLKVLSKGRWLKSQKYPWMTMNKTEVVLV
jgi:hypothetical protein